MELLVWELEGGRYGLDAREVREVVRAVAVSRLPGAPPVVLGVIGVRGELVPVFDLRRRFGLPPRPLDPSEHFVLARTGTRTAALRVDAVVGLRTAAPELLADARASVPRAERVAGVARLPDGLVVVVDLGAFLAHAEEMSLAAALAAAGAEDAA